MTAPESLPDVLSKSEFARFVHLSTARISQLVKQGLPLAGGKVDVVPALRWMGKELDPLQRQLQNETKPRGVIVRVVKAGTAKSETPAGEVQADQSEPAINVMSDVSGEAEPDFRAVRTDHERIKAERAALELAKARGELVPVDVVKRVVFARARAERDAWLSFAMRVAPQLAAELRCDPGTLHRLLSEAVRDQLSELAETRVVEFEQ